MKAAGLALVLLASTASAVAGPPPTVGPTAGEMSRLVQWGRIDLRLRSDPGRTARMEDAVAYSQPLADRLESDRSFVPSWDEWSILSDRASALVDLRRFAEVASLEQRMESVEGRPVRPYVAAAAGTSLLEMREPERAIPLLERAVGALELWSDEWEQAAVALYWALDDAGREAEGSALLTRWIADAPARLRSGEPNPAWLELRILRVLQLLRSNRPGEAHVEVRKLQQVAPFHAGVREAVASVSGARGLTRRSLEDLALLAAIDPADLGDRGREVDLLLTLHRYEEAEAALARARECHPDASSVKRAARSWETFQRAEVYADATYAASSNQNPLGAQEWMATLWGFSEPVDLHWRLYARAIATGATFSGDVTTWARGAAGVEWTPPDWRLRLDLSEGTSERLGASLSTVWTPSDRWSLDGHLAAISDALPMQAWRSGILVNLDAALAATRSWSESTRASVGASWQAFSDTNQRVSISGAATQRLLGSSRFVITGALSLWGGLNTLANAPYFNPAWAWSASAEARVDWQTWQRYERRFDQRLTASTGASWQVNYGALPLWKARYEHVWQLGYDLALQYGIVASQIPYDGALAFALGGNVMLDWRF